MRLLLALLATATLLSACESDRPMTRAGNALDHAGTKTGEAVGTAAEDTGAAINRAGNWVGRKLSP